MERFDLVEYRAARTMGEVDYFFRHQKRIIAARMDLPPKSLFDRILMMKDRFLMKDKKL